MQSQAPIVRDLVLVGGGHAHVGVLRRLAMKPVPGVRITLINRDAMTPYSGMLPGYVAGHYTHDECHIDLVPLSAFAGARFVEAEVTGLDPERRLVHLKDRPSIAYDLVSLNLGSAPSFQGVPGAAEHTTPVKPIAGFVQRWQRILKRAGTTGAPLKIGVVGGGAGGVELILAMAYRLRRERAKRGLDADALSFHLIQGAKMLLPTHPDGVREKLKAKLKERGIAVSRGCRIVRAEEGALIAENGAQFDLDEVLWTTQAGPAPWLEDTGLDVDKRGFVTVQATLQSTNYPNVFAAGDVAHVLEHPREKAGVFAVRQGPPLADNLARVLRGEAPKPFKPQSSFLTLISTGDRYAVGAKGPLVFAGGWAWTWKDHIDRKFMRRFNDLPEMEADAPDLKGAAEGVAEALGEGMRCGGCGAKVGARVLSRTLSGLRPVPRTDVLAGIGDDAAVLTVPEGCVQVQTVDHFRAFLDDPYLLGEIGALHAMSDVWAMGAAPQAIFPMVTLPPMTPEKQETTLAEVMAGVAAAAKRAGAAIAGGHTAEGAEMAIGFAVTGLAPRDRVMGKAGAEPGDALIVTKPIGTGVILAANMAGKAKGRWLSAAIAAMRQSNAEAARVLLKHGAHALTDVTGFGLAGHLSEMLHAGGVAADVEAEAVPLLPGAEALAGAGVRSTLMPENKRIARGIGADETLQASPRYDLLFDPQTAGGLLAAVPEDRAGEAMTALEAAGVTGAAIVGRVVAARVGSPRIVLG
ncbi:MAG: selenide, water dikinase SelD [Alphaproteobacteria bacterium]|nr:selenide, water dikinase SelD [Alphaproteobacteria bacterium]MDX5369905.1 selenide, water dikinase SelD [Alphaproteobacteria bacterium]MDX5464501.1 selenide, water dikinase SelD [Alphaproteobacteria bacterium]